MTNADKPMVWVVDDQDDNIMIVESILANAGYQTRSAENGRKALEMLQQGERPDLVLLDIVMPEVDGFEFLDSFRRNSDTQSIPVVMLTALGRSSDVIKSMKHGATDYCVKPIDPDDVIETVARCLAKSRAEE